MFNFQIPIKNCIFCIDQLILILQKVIKDYSDVTKGNMEIKQLTEIAKQIEIVSESLYEYIRTFNEYDRMVEVNKIEEIKE